MGKHCTGSCKTEGKCDCKKDKKKKEKQVDPLRFLYEPGLFKESCENHGYKKTLDRLSKSLNKARDAYSYTIDRVSDVITVYDIEEAIPAINDIVLLHLMKTEKFGVMHHLGKKFAIRVLDTLLDIYTDEAYKFNKKEVIENFTDVRDTIKNTDIKEFALSNHEGNYNCPFLVNKEKGLLEFSPSDLKNSMYHAIKLIRSSEYPNGKYYALDYAEKDLFLKMVRGLYIPKN